MTFSAYKFQNERNHLSI